MVELIEENISISVGKWLQEKGFSSLEDIYADCWGYYIYRSKPNIFNYLIGMIDVTLIGRLKLNERTYTMPAEKNWIFEVFGENNMKLINSLAAELAAKFDVKISVKLTKNYQEIRNFFLW